MSGNQFDNGGANNDPIGHACNVGCLFGGANAKTNRDGQDGLGLEAGDGFIDARLRSNLQAGDTSNADIIKKARCTIEDGGKPCNVSSRRRQTDKVDASAAKGRAKLRVFFWRNVDADDTVNVRFAALGCEPVSATDGHWIGISH